MLFQRREKEKIFKKAATKETGAYKEVQKQNTEQTFKTSGKKLLKKAATKKTGPYKEVQKPNSKAH